MSETNVQFSTVTPEDVQKKVKALLAIAGVITQFTETTKDDEFLEAASKFIDQPWFAAFIATMFNQFLAKGEMPTAQQVAAMLPPA